MRAFLTLLRLDATVAWRSRFLHVVLLAGTLFGLLIRFVLPAEVVQLPWDVEVATAPVHHVVTALHGAGEPAPFRGRFVSVMLGLDVVLLGLLFGGVMILQEKMEGTIRFYRVGPGGAAAYLASKVLVNAGLAGANTLVLVGLAAPHGLASPALWGLVLGVAMTFTLLGLGLSTFFRNLSSFFYPLAAIGFVLSLPMIAYTSPSLGLRWLRVIPTYEVMFVGRELLYPSGRGVDAGLTAAIVVLPLLAAFAFAYWAVERRLLREAA